MIVIRPTYQVLNCLAIAGILAGGCRAPKASDFKPSKIFSMKSSWPWRDGPDEGIPLRVVGTWTDTVLHQPGQKPQRGFGGRLMFYGRDEKEPILVDGQLVVYAFDETCRNPTDNKPTRRYVFPPDQLPLHMSESEIGASYSFWLPWDEAGGQRTEVSLICRFEPKGGAVITGEQTKHLLPGALAPQSATTAQQPPLLPEGVPSRPARMTLESLRSAQQHAPGDTQLTSYESPAGPGVVTPAQVQTATLVPERKMSVTSIRVPSNFQVGAGAIGAYVPPLSRPAGNNLVQQPAQSVQLPAAQAVPAPATPTTLQRPGPFAPRQLARPQFATPQFMSVEPAPVTTGMPMTVTHPAAAAAAPGK
jgi:hypothetical protein